MKTIVLFDGVCNLCNSTVQFIIRHDPLGQFQFASQQSEIGQKLLAKHGIQTAQALADSVVVIEGDTAWLETEGASPTKPTSDNVAGLEEEKIWLESDAALQILYRLGGFWSLFAGLKIIPKPLRDWVYRLIAQNRYRLFGQRQSCMIPTPEHKKRFLDAA